VKHLNTGNDHPGIVGLRLAEQPVGNILET
jgi:hypothetical protein